MTEYHWAVCIKDYPDKSAKAGELFEVVDDTCLFRGNEFIAFLFAHLQYFEPVSDIDYALMKEGERWN